MRGRRPSQWKEEWGYRVGLVHILRFLIQVLNFRTGQVSVQNYSKLITSQTSFLERSREGQLVI